jgi:hypothetical protein
MLKTINKARGFFYQLTRLLGDVNAVSRGPEAMAKRYGRKMLYRTFSKGINKLFK